MKFPQLKLKLSHDQMMKKLPLSAWLQAINSPYTMYREADLVSKDVLFGM